MAATAGVVWEAGNPKIRERSEYMKSYCPYTNLGDVLRID
jgi:protease II